MALQVWLPLNKDYINQGLMSTIFTNQNNATLNTGSPLGGCYSFSGSNWLVENVIDWSTFDASSFSIAFWMKLDSNSGNRQIVHIGSSSGWNNIRIGVLTTGNALSFSISDGSSYVAYNMGIPSQYGVWHHYTVTFSNKIMKWYRDGVYQKSYTVTYNPAFTSAHHFSIGAAPNGNEALIGSVCDVRFYDNCLSDKEIKQLSLGLAAHYQLSIPETEMIPDEYQEVEYLESTGVQWINTGVIINTWPFSLSARMAWMTNGNGERDFWGNFSAISQTASSYCWVVGQQNNSNWYQWASGVWVPASGKTTNTIYNTKFEYLGQTGRRATINGTVYTTTANNGNSIIPTDSPIGLFSGAGTRGYCLPAVRIYSASIEHQGEIIRQFVPCYRKSDNKPGMYDRITQTFFVNQGTGADFILGTSKATLPNYTCVYDTSGYARNCNHVIGNLRPVKIKSPRYNTCTYFDGNSYAYSDAGTFKDYDFNNLTMSVWVKTETKHSGYSGGFGLSHDGSQNQKTFQYTDYGGLAQVNYNNTAYTNTKITEDDIILDWHHYCLTLSNSTECACYIDGILIKTFSIDWKTSTVSSGTFFELGVDMPGSNETFKGWAVDARMYGTALSAVDVKELYETSMMIDSNDNISPRILS